MKNRLALLLTILMVSGLWSFAQVAPAPQPKPQPDPQPQPQPTPIIELVPPPEGGEIRIDDGGNDFIRRGQYDRALQQKLGTRQQDLGTRQQDLGIRQQDLAGARQQDLAAREAFAYRQKTEKGSYIGLATSPIPTV